MCREFYRPWVFLHANKEVQDVSNSTITFFFIVRHNILILGANEIIS